MILLNDLTNLHIITLSIFITIIVTLIIIRHKSRTIKVEGFNDFDQNIQRSVLYNINMGGLEQTYDDNMMSKKKEPKFYAAQMLDNQQRERKLLKAVVVQREEEILEKLKMATVNLENSKRAVQFALGIIAANVDSLSSAAGDYLVYSNNILDENQKVYDAVSIAYAEAKKNLYDVTNLIEMAAEHEQAEKLFNPYRDPANSGQIIECNELSPS
jgi:hypothetical protein